MADLLSTAQSPWAQGPLWDQIQIGSLLWRGKFEIKGADRKYNWNVGSGYGFSGAFEIFTSQPPAKFSITFYLWADEQYASYLLLLDALLYSPTHMPPNSFGALGKAVNALALVHPMLKNNRISQVVVEKVGALEKQSDDLLFSFTVDLIEFFPQKPLPPQSPDTAADKNPVHLDPAEAALVKQNLDNAAELQNVASQLGITSALPNPR